VLWKFQLFGLSFVFTFLDRMILAPYIAFARRDITVALMNNNIGGKY
jgi:hypothetical protein